VVYHCSPWIIGKENKMEKEMNLITDKEKVIAHHYWTEKGWMIVWKSGLEKEVKEKYFEELNKKARELEIEVEFKDEN